MFSSANTGGVVTSIQVHPWRMMLLAFAMMGVGIAMVSSGTLWFLAGIPLALLGGYLCYIAGRQIYRGVRTLLS